MTKTDDATTDTRRFAPALDLHAHFLISAYLTKRDFGQRHKARRWFKPFASVTDLPRLREGGMDGQVFTVYFPGRPFVRDNRAKHDRIIDRYFAMLLENGQDMRHCESPDDYVAAQEAGQFAAILAIEGGHCLDGDVDNVDHFHARGVRIFQLSHFIPNELADATESKRRPHEGLNDLGRQVVERLNDRGMIVDVAHMTEEGIRKVADTCDAPFISSHTGVRAHRDMERNLSDDSIDAIAKSGGLMGIILFPPYLKKGLSGTTDDVVDHLAHIAERVGTEHIAIGSDTDGPTWLPKDMRDATDFQVISERMLTRGFTREDIARMWGGNFMRVWREVDARAKT
jgi:membrane dipeptidase